MVNPSTPKPPLATHPDRNLPTSYLPLSLLTSLPSLLASPRPLVRTGRFLTGLLRATNPEPTQPFLVSLPKGISTFPSYPPSALRTQPNPGTRVCTPNPQGPDNETRSVPQHRPDLTQRVHRRSHVDYRVTVRTDRSQVLDWIDSVVRPNLRYRTYVVDMDIPSTNTPVAISKIYVADSAPRTVVLDAGSPGCAVSLIPVDGHPLHGTFCIDPGRHIIRPFE